MQVLKVRDVGGTLGSTVRANSHACIYICSSSTDGGSWVSTKKGKLFVFKLQQYAMHCVMFG